MLQNIRVQLIRNKLSREALSHLWKGKKLMKEGMAMYREGRVNLKKAKALIAEEKADREEDKKRSIEVGGKGCTGFRQCTRFLWFLSLDLRSDSALDDN